MRLEPLRVFGGVFITLVTESAPVIVERTRADASTTTFFSLSEADALTLGLAERVGVVAGRQGATLPARASARFQGPG